MNSVLVNSCCYNESTIAYLDGLNNRNLSLTIQQVVKFKVKECTKSVPGEEPLPGLKALLLCPLVCVCVCVCVRERERERDLCREVNKMAPVRLSCPTLSYPLTPCSVSNEVAQLCNS